ncbi:FapA family protein [Desulfovibrio sp. OttesenSCG-928-G11]|nr:FapA family protein [Desulfovibrio sp. OttesenSCG-928-G11]
MYYLLHYFDPDFNHMQLSPSSDSGNLRYLGYVQNVVAGQLLAELINPDDFPGMRRDPRFLYAEGHLPVGPNCGLHPDNPQKIIALENGYVFYHNGLISVKKLLNVRGHVGFHTGNIYFVGDMAVHGDVQTGFSLFSKNILVKGRIESSKVKGMGDVVCLGGIKGDNSSAVSDGPDKTSDDPDAPLPTTLVSAEGNMRLPFCEHAQLRAAGNLIIDGSCLHSTLYVGGNLVVKGRLQGGTVYANGLVYVERQLGSDYSMPTRIMMGYDPFDFLVLQKLESQIAILKDKRAYFQRMAERNPIMQQEYEPRLDIITRKLKVAEERHMALWRKFAVDEQNAPKCRILVPGTVMPGCEIGIAKAWRKTESMDENVTFSLVGDDILCRRNNSGNGS